MKRLLPVFLLTLTACASQYIIDKPEAEVKSEKPLWNILQHKEEGKSEFKYEDKWYEYDADFEYIQPGELIARNMLFSQCPVAVAEYTVKDKETGEVVRRETIPQVPCSPCHKR